MPAGNIHHGFIENSLYESPGTISRRGFRVHREEERRGGGVVTVIHCDNDKCKYNEDQLCTRADMYCVGRRCRSERHMTYIDLMRGRDPCPHM